MDADVVVVGYGPTGMTLAALLSQYGYRVVVLERYDGLYNLPRAAIFDDETMRTLDKLGIAGEMLPRLRVQRNYEWCNARGELLIEHDFAERGRSGWAEWYMMYQPELEDALDRVCRSAPTVAVRFASPVVAVRQTGTGVQLDVERPGQGAETVTARYVVACDGGNSTVRRELGVDQHDYGFSEPWMVCDFEFRRPVDLPPARQLGDPAGPTSIISLGPGHHRFSFMLDAAEDFGTECHPDLVWKRVSDYLAPDDATLIRVATYTFRSLVASRWRADRVILAGDAAHQMPPFLGQGMCSGIRDAQNLAFKLDLVLSGRAGDDLLGTYQAEREPHVRAVIEKGIELGRLQTIRDPAAAAERDRRLLAARAAGGEPEKLYFPGLAAGFLSGSPAAGRGELSVQGDVDDGTRHGRFDEIVGRGFVVVVTESLRHALADCGAVSQLLARDVHLVAVTDQPADITVAAPGFPAVLDVAGVYRRWLAERGAVAAVIRPDFYVYGCAGDAASARALLAELATDLAGGHVRSGTSRAS